MTCSKMSCTQTIAHRLWAGHFYDVMHSNDIIMACYAAMHSYGTILWNYLIGQLLSCIVLTPKHVHTSSSVYKPCGIEGQSSDCPFCALYELADFASIIICMDSLVPAIISLTFALVTVTITTLSFTTLEDIAIAAILT